MEDVMQTPASAASVKARALGGKPALAPWFGALARHEPRTDALTR